MLIALWLLSVACTSLHTEEDCDSRNLFPIMWISGRETDSTFIHLGSIGFLDSKSVATIRETLVIIGSKSSRRLRSCNTNAEDWMDQDPCCGLRQAAYPVRVLLNYNGYCYSYSIKRRHSNSANKRTSNTLVHLEIGMTRSGVPERPWQLPMYDWAKYWPDMYTNFVGLNHSIPKH